MLDSSDRDTAMSTGESDSVPLSAAASKATSGGSSLSSMVQVWMVVAPRVPRTGSLRVTMTVSSTSSTGSSTTAT